MTKSKPGIERTFPLTHIAVVDTETSGLDERQDRVLQWALVLCRLPTFSVEQVRTCYVDPSYNAWRWDEKRDAGALAINGITEELIAAHGILPERALDLVFDVPGLDWQTTAFTGWGVDFDLRFTLVEFERRGRKPPFRYRVFDARSACLAVDLALGTFLVMLGQGQGSPLLEYLGLGQWLEETQQTKLVADMEAAGHFKDIDAELAKRKVREHDAVCDALQTVRALRIAQAYTVNGVTSLFETSRLGQREEEAGGA